MAGCYGGSGGQGADYAYTNITQCGCCREEGCTTEGGCQGCEDDCHPNSLDGRIRFGYTCQGCDVCGADPQSPYYNLNHSGVYQKCVTPDSTDLVGIPCVDHDYSYVMVTIDNFSPGVGTCTFGGVYLLNNLRIVQTGSPFYCHTICNGGLFPQGLGCIWSYSGGHRQAPGDPPCSVPPLGCNECTMLYNFSFPCQYGFSSFGISFQLNDPIYNTAVLRIGIGNFLFPVDMHAGQGNCAGCSEAYIIPSGTRFQCRGPNILTKIPKFPDRGFDTQAFCAFPGTVTVEALF
jgi:hypothetical protein